jgi:hypothetical protein
MGTCAHLNGDLHKFLPSIRVAVCVSSFVATRELLGKNVTAVSNIHTTIKELLDASFYILLCFELR